MGRLIDADVVEKALREYADDVGCKRGEYELANGILKAVGYIRHNIPTAYDVEKVEEELLNKRELYRIREIESLRKGESLNIGVNLAKQASIEDCIEVVKRGGVE